MLNLITQRNSIDLHGLRYPPPPAGSGPWPCGLAWRRASGRQLRFSEVRAAGLHPPGPCAQQEGGTEEPVCALGRPREDTAGGREPPTPGGRFSPEIAPETVATGHLGPRPQAPGWEKRRKPAGASRRGGGGRCRARAWIEMMTLSKYNTGNKPLCIQTFVLPKQDTHSHITCPVHAVNP